MSREIWWNNDWQGKTDGTSRKTHSRATSPTINLTIK
jgi:hypothetical protein